MDRRVIGLLIRGPRTDEGPGLPGPSRSAVSDRGDDRRDGLDDARDRGRVRLDLREPLRDDTGHVRRIPGLVDRDASNELQQVAWNGGRPAYGAIADPDPAAVDAEDLGRRSPKRVVVAVDEDD